jgi:hypothetical protein
MNIIDTFVTAEEVREQERKFKEQKLQKTFDSFSKAKQKEILKDLRSIKEDIDYRTANDIDYGCYPIEDKSCEYVRFITHFLEYKNFIVKTNDSYITIHWKDEASTTYDESIIKFAD